jgi:DUF4097 and DUF4098 domain-containing protein YvlB
MNTSPTRRDLLSGVLPAVVASTTGCVDTTVGNERQTVTSQTLSLDGATSLTVENSHGDVTIRHTDRTDIRVQSTRQSNGNDEPLSKLELRTASQDDRLRLRTEWTGPTGLSTLPELHLRITLPQSLSVTSVSTGSGDVSVIGGPGDTTISTGSGDVDITGSAGPVDISTNSGDQEVDDVDGVVTAESGSGDISVLGTERVQNLESGSGDITAEVATVADTTRFTSGSGDQSVSVSRELDADLRVETDSGDIDVSAVTLSDTTRNEERVVGTLGDGGALFNLVSSSGDVTVSYVD